MMGLGGSPSQSYTTMPGSDSVMQTRGGSSLSYHLAVDGISREERDEFGGSLRCLCPPVWLVEDVSLIFNHLLQGMKI